MPAPATNALTDGLSLVKQGMHSGVQARLLPIDQVAFALNMTFRNGLPRTRPNWRKLAVTYADDATQGYATQALFQDGAFYQGYGSNENCLMAAVGGRVFRYLINGGNASVQDVSVVTAVGALTANFVVPAVGGAVVIAVTSSALFSVGQPVSVAGGGYRVTALVNPTHIQIQNLHAAAGTTVVIPPPLTTLPISIYGDLNDSQSANCWTWQAEDFLVINNGAQNPLFWDGARLRRSNGGASSTKPELPPGCMGTYVQGRIWMVLPDVNQQPSQAYIAGDLVYSHGYTGPYGGRDAVLLTTELSLFSGGSQFAVPVSSGPITGMGTAAVMDTSLGQGALQVHTLTSVHSVNAGWDRATWFTQNNIQIVVSLPNYGTVSQDSLTAVNGDSWYRSLDGIRSYQIGRRDQGTWVNTPLSVEVERILQRDTAALLSKASAVLFNNRRLQTCSPFSVPGRGTAHRGLVALDFNNVSTLTTRSNPCYDGLWTGVFVLKIVKGSFGGRERCFAWGLGCDGSIELWELLGDDEAYFDWDGGATVSAEWAVETRSMGFRDNGNQLKRLLTADLYFDKIAGNDNARLALKYRSDEDPIWRDWPVCASALQAVLCAPIRDCEANLCAGFTDVREQYRTFLRWPDPPDTPCSELTGRSPRTGYEFQVRLWGKGHAQLNRMHVWAAALGDSVRNIGVTNHECVVLRGCDEPWFNYVVNGCGQVPPAPPLPPWPPYPPPEPTPPTGGVPSIIEEDGTPITTEGGVDGGPGIRTEDQLDVPVVPTPTPPPPYPNLPAWPPPVPVGCPGETLGPDLQVFDQIKLISHVVAINPGAQDPNVYVIGWKGQACLEAWAAAVWGNFVALAIPYSQARLVWASTAPTLGFMGTEVFPDELGNYAEVASLNMNINVQYCP